MIWFSLEVEKSESHGPTLLIVALTITQRIRKMNNGMKEQLRSILDFSPTLRYVLLVREDGKSEESVGRDSTESFEPEEETKMVLRRFAIGRGMTSGSEKYFGRMLTLIVRREKLVELLFPLARNHMVLVSADPTFPLELTPQLEALVRSLRLGKTS